MSKFNQLANIKENFDDNLYHTDSFKATKGLLYNFGEYINKNKGVIYGLLGATALNFISNALPHQPITEQAPIAAHEQMIQQNDQGMDLYSKIKEYKDNINLGNNIANTNYSGIGLQALGQSNINRIGTLEEGETMVVKNPFWSESILTLSNSHTNGSAYYNHVDNGVLENVKDSLLLVNNNENNIDVNLQDVAWISSLVEISNHQLITKYLVYHEAAHSSFRQSHQFGQDQDVVNREMHSDFASTMLIGVESQSLDTFNEIVDGVIKFRVRNLDHDLTHNTAYAMMEFKKVINENPDLLKMKVEDISEFAYIVSSKIKTNDFKDTNKNFIESNLISLSKSNILNDVDNNKNTAMMNHFGESIVKRSGFDIVEYKESTKVNPMRMEKIADRILREVGDKIDYGKLTQFMYLTNKGDRAKTIEMIKQSVESHSIISKDVLDPIKQKINMDQLNYDFSKIQDIKLAQIAKQAQNYVSKSDFKI